MKSPTQTGASGVGMKRHTKAGGIRGKAPPNREGRVTAAAGRAITTARHAIPEV